MKNPKTFKEAIKKGQEEVIDTVTVSKERVAVVIGKKGETRRQIERLTGTKLSINSDTGVVEISRKIESDALRALRAQDLVKAIAAGFSPQKAFKLLNENIYIDAIDLHEFCGDANLKRIKARIIGREGKARKQISRLAGVEVVIARKEIFLIGEPEKTAVAREAVLKIIEGLPHRAVYRFLERKKREMR